MNRRLTTVLSVWLLVLCTSVTAQLSNGVDFRAWDALTKLAPVVIDDPQSGETSLIDLRARLVVFRAKFEEISGQDAVRIAGLRDQLTALGTAPTGEDAMPEPLDVSAKRAELTAKLNQLLAPVQTAQASYLSADGSIRQIDQILRERQAEKLLQLGPSPLNPALWPQTVTDLRDGFAKFWQQDAASTDRADWTLVLKALPITIPTVLIGLFLILRGRLWTNRLVGWLRQFGANGAGIWSLLASLLHILLPLLGVVSLVVGASYSGLFGPNAVLLLSILPVVGASLLGVRLIADRVFSREDDDALLLNTASERRHARFYVGIITVVISISAVLSLILDQVGTTASSKTVLGFPLALIICFALSRIGALLRGYTDTLKIEGAGEETARLTTLCRVVRAIGKAAFVVAFLTPVLMAAGYQNAASALLAPFTISLGLLGLLMVLQRFCTDLYGLFSKQGRAARDSLMAVVFGFFLLMLALPVLALIWGARVTDLTELWAIFNRGFAVGDSRISPSNFLTVVVIFTIGYILTRLIQGMLRGNVLPKTKIDIGAQNAMVSGIGYVGLFLAAIAAITGAGIDLSSLAIVAGALSVGIGFGLQNIVSNFVSGIILLIERPISEGDWIEVGGKMGYVRDISVRSTRIETFDRTDVIVPNADLVSGTVTNYTRGNTVGRVIVPVGVAYGTDTKQVESILREIALEQPMVLAAPAPSIYFVNFGADALEFEVRCFLRDVNWMMVVKNDINHAIAARFAQAGIEIPFAQRDLWLRNPETLGQSPKSNGTLQK